ncbi:hypothetical protein DesyoDRAFT_1068 [Desulfosporosinus youngiae DSM 17734]|uniref:Uncharacterized protein n=1 Tax=Desulfosporosinus youngiae DSM 17734 TaxID=768710 RepID=H5Y241_9FIRM|nr:hypothetical protein DesyoDRAFT_1068 [Desulfosporosinus youngiae DSM 17734]
MLVPICLCGQVIRFEPGQTVTFCKTPGCGVVQEKLKDGYLARGTTRNLYTPIFTKPNHYERYMRWRNTHPRPKRRRWQ